MDPDLGNFEGIFSLPLWDKGNLAHLANIPRSCQQLLMNFLGVGYFICNKPCDFCVYPDQDSDRGIFSIIFTARRRYE